MILGLIGISMPVYWLGEVMNLITQSRYHDTWLFSWVPPLGYKNFSDDPKGWFLTLVIPWITLVDPLYRPLRPRAARLPHRGAAGRLHPHRARQGPVETRILLRHALRTSLVAFVTLFGLDFGALVGGSALLTEVVFGLQGVGKLTYDALLNLDLPIIMTTVMYASFFVVMANALVDIVYMLLDPRVRIGLMLAVRDLRCQLPHRAGPRARRRWRLASTWRRRDCWASSANPALARPSRCWPSWA